MTFHTEYAKKSSNQTFVFVLFKVNKYPCIAIFAKFFVFVFVCVFVFVLFKVNEYPWMAIFAKSAGLDQGGCGATLVLLML